MLKEIYTISDNKKEEFPFYEYFYYTDYLNGEYISKKLGYRDETNYPVLKKYLGSKNDQKDDNNDYTLDNLNFFNNVLNLINEKYYYKIPREYAEKKTKRGRYILIIRI